MSYQIGSITCASTLAICFFRFAKKKAEDMYRAFSHADTSKDEYRKEDRSTSFKNSRSTWCSIILFQPLNGLPWRQGGRMAPDMLSSIVSPPRQEAQDLGVTPTQAAAESNLARTVAESNEEEARKQIQIGDGFSHWQQWLGRRIKSIKADRNPSIFYRSQRYTPYAIHAIRTFVPPHIPLEVLRNTMEY